MASHEQPLVSGTRVGPDDDDAPPLLSPEPLPVTTDPLVPGPVDVGAGSPLSSVVQGITTNDASASQPVVPPSLLPGKIVSKLSG